MPAPRDITDGLLGFLGVLEMFHLKLHMDIARTLGRLEAWIDPRKPNPPDTE